MPNAKPSPKAATKKPAENVRTYANVNATGWRYEVMLGSSYGCPEPRINVASTSADQFRALRAETFRLAAALELASGGERWVVGTRQGSGVEACVYLELASGGGSTLRDEQDRAMALLRAILEKAKG